MARFRNDFGEDRVVPTLGYVLVPAGMVVTVPADESHHWEAGGWTALDPDPRSAPEPEADATAAAPAASPTAPLPTERPAVLAKTPSDVAPAAAPAAPTTSEDAK
jgi:hypothetical protein